MLSCRHICNILYIFCVEYSVLLSLGRINISCFHFPPCTQFIFSCKCPSPCCSPRKPFHPDVQSSLLVQFLPIQSDAKIIFAARPKEPPSSLDFLSVHLCEIFPSNLPTALEGLPHCPPLLPGHRRIATCGECPL